MSDPQSIFRDAVVSGSAASIVSAATLALLGKVERGNAVMPLNAPSQWLWGEQAAYSPRADLRHTAVGFAIHHASAIFWAAIHERIFSGRRRGSSPAHWLAQGAATAALASFVDYQLTPRRLRPGFEKHLRRPELFLVYAAFALGLAAPRLAGRSSNDWQAQSAGEELDTQSAAARGDEGAVSGAQLEYLELTIEEREDIPTLFSDERLGER